jgi:hypothetical protein
MIVKELKEFLDTVDDNTEVLIEDDLGSNASVTTVKLDDYFPNRVLIVIDDDAILDYGNLNF